MGFTVSALAHLEASDFTHIKELIQSATVQDDLAPLSEHVLIHLNHGGDEHDEHIVARTDDGIVIGYLHLDQTDEVAGPVVELVVHPRHRRMGVGRALVQAATERAGDARLRLWAHGELAMAYALASDLGFKKTRELWQMRRSLFSAMPKYEVPAEIAIRSFVPGQDEEAWLALNAEVFAEHPEQGQLSRHDLDVRMSEGWFDPSGFLLACKGDKLVGFHWTKIHGGRRSGGHDHPEIGEIYVLGIAPSERGTGLSKALSIKGLEYLRDEGLGAAMLYVDSDNESAKHLYESIGFMHWDTDVMFTRA